MKHARASRTKHFLKGRRLETLVENKTSYTVQQAEMHLFETHQKAEQVLLQLDYPVLASMLEGRKVMHLKDIPSFDFLPGESLVLGAREMMCIDFPEASRHQPTRCLAMGIAEEMIDSTITLMNERMPKLDDVEWREQDFRLTCTNDVAVYQLIQHLMYLFAEDHVSKDTFVNLTLQELIIRIIQSNARKNYLEQTNALSNDNNRLSFIKEYIRTNLDEPLSIEVLSQKVHMSTSNFFRVFKNEFGISPVDYINQERIRLASSLLKDPKRKIKEVYQACGFNSLSYFNRVFKKNKKVSPSVFQQMCQK
ncbi:MAG: AraC family transcriptional regulator [Bacteroidota bacterium]